MAKTKADRTDLAKLVEDVMRAEHIHKNELAEILGVSKTQVYNYFNGNMTIDSFMKIIDALGYGISLRPKELGGRMSINGLGDCDKCRYKTFTDSVYKTLDKYRENCEDVGTEIDFY